MSESTNAAERNTERKPLFSVISVCYNAKSLLPEARKSLVAQTLQDFEWVVIDGASPDGTARWVEQHKTPRTTLISEPDDGIFDAMNKGIRASSGTWLYFLNADDRFFDDKVLEDVWVAIRGKPHVQLVYGDVMYFTESHAWRRRFHWVTKRKLVYGDLCHQAVFARRDLFEKFGTFRTEFKYNADFEWLVRAATGGAAMQYIHRDIARFFAGGTHVKAGLRHVEERGRVRRLYRSHLQCAIGHKLLRLELRLRTLLGC